MSAKRLGTSLLTLIARFGQPTPREVVAVQTAEITGQQIDEAREMGHVERQLNRAAAGQGVTVAADGTIDLAWCRSVPEVKSTEPCEALSDVFRGTPCLLADGHLWTGQKHDWGELR